MSEQVVVVGAGPAGLSVAACLSQRGIGATVLEAAAQVGSAWRAHYSRLHLHTHRGGSALPGFGFPREYPRYPSRQQVVDYLEAYAAHFKLTPAFDERVTGLERTGESWALTTSKRALQAKHVVLSTGLTRVPARPDWPGLATFRGPVLHSSQYRDGSAWKGQRVLVVGIGNSGGEIAVDLHEHGALPTIAVRSAVNVIPRELLGLPILAVSALLRPFPARVADVLAAPLLAATVGDITRVGLRKLPYGAMEQIITHGRIPLIDVGTLALLREGHLKLAPGVQRFTETSAVFEGGAEHPFDAVVLATGYRPCLEDVLPDSEELRDASGQLRSGVEVRPGLHLCGLRASTRGMLAEIAHEARAVADGIAAAIRRPGSVSRLQRT